MFSRNHLQVVLMLDFRCLAFLKLHNTHCVTGLAREKGTISEDTLRSAFSATEDGFLTLVRRTCGIKPLMAAIGSCCLVGVIWRGTLYIANLGDSRAVIGCLGRSNKIIAEQLTKDHNASMEEVRQELRTLHPDDSHIVVMKHGVWRIKGIIQVFSHFIFFPTTVTVSFMLWSVNLLNTGRISFVFFTCSLSIFILFSCIKTPFISFSLY